jgi:DNA sulfur modification protein DndE
VTIDHCTVGHAHGGFVIGSEMSGGVRNVTVTNCTFKGTDNGLRFKSTRGRGGAVENIHVSNITMSDIHDAAITFDMYYMIKGGGNGVPVAQPVTEATPIFKNFQISDITCAGAKKSILIRGLPEMPIEGISLENVQISADQGVSLIDARDISLKNVHVDCKVAPAVEQRNVAGLKTDKFESVVVQPK